MDLHWADITVLVVYFTAMTVMGFYFARKNVNTEEYFLGGRAFSGWVIGLSLVGTSISSITFLSYPGDAFKTTWIRYIANFALPVAVLIAAFVFLPFFRKAGITSAYEYLEDRFGPSVRVYTAIAFIVSQLVRVSIILYLVSLVIHEMIGLSPVNSVLIAGVFVSLYTIIGGIDAVIWTDVIQTIVLLFGGLLCLGIIIDKLPDGLSQIFTIASQHDKLSFNEYSQGMMKPISWGFSLSKKTGLMIFMLGLFNWLTEYSSNQNTIQRYCASRSTRQARIAMFVCVAASLPIWAFYMFLGTSLFAFFEVFPADAATEMLTGASKPERILPFFIMKYLPVGIKGCVIAAALAAAMSSLDSSINAISTIGITDIYKRHLVKGKTDRHYLKVAWIFAFTAAVFMVGGAILLINWQTQTLQDAGLMLGSLLGAGMLGIYLLGFLTKVGDARSVWVGIAATLLFTLWTILTQKQILPTYLSVPFDLYYTTIFGNLIMFFVGFLASFLLPSRKRNLDELTIWTLPEENR